MSSGKEYRDGDHHSDRPEWTFRNKWCGELRGNERLIVIDFLYKHPQQVECGRDVFVGLFGIFFELSDPRQADHHNKVLTSTSSILYMCALLNFCRHLNDIIWTLFVIRSYHIFKEVKGRLHSLLICNSTIWKAHAQSYPRWKNGISLDSLWTIFGQQRFAQEWLRDARNY